jgi:hypothetical protein
MTSGTVGAATRNPAVAGTFYAGTERLREQVRALLPADTRRQPVVGAVAPHAGYLYSGGVAAAVYARIEPPATLVILGPNHTGEGAEAALMTEGSWATPLGEVGIDRALARAILKASRTLEEDALAHRDEHSIEVQLPFIQVLMPQAQFVPICLMSLDLAACRDVGRAVAQAARETGRPVVVVASTDMSHYLPRDVAGRKDRQAIAAMEALDAEGLFAVVRRERITMCGVHATVAALVAAKALGAARGHLVQYATSGEISGDYQQVVGYAGLLLI